MEKFEPMVGIYIYERETGLRGEIVGCVPSVQSWQIMMPQQPIQIVNLSEFHERYSDRQGDCVCPEEDPYAGDLIRKNF